MPNLRKAAFIAAFLALFGTGSGSVFVHQVIDRDKALLEQAIKVIQKEGTSVIESTGKGLRIHQELHLGTVVFYLEKDSVQIETLKGVSYDDKTYLRNMTLIDKARNGTIDQVITENYIIGEGIMPDSGTDVTYINVDLLPFHHEQAEYITLLKLLSQKRFTEIMNRYRLPYRRPKGILFA